MIKKTLPFIILHLFLFATFITEAQPNDFQCSPHNFGLLPGAAPCGLTGGVIYGTSISIPGTTLAATNDSLSGAITSCYSNLTVPLKDVWYQFTASETHVEITIIPAGASPLSDPYIAIYESVNNECIGLMPRDCFSAMGTGTFTKEFGPLTYGVKYYLQVASAGSTGDGGFSINIRSKNNCTDCLKNSILQSYPLPVQAAYPPDTTVGFCYSVIGYKERFGNRLHGIVPIVGNGWDMSTLKIISTASSADFKGEWKWFNNININGGIGSGFFYDVGNDNNPTNNLGDEGSVTTLWTFCFTIKTKNKISCNGGQNDLSIEFNTYSDNESGSLITTQNCSGDKNYTFKAHMSCCPKPFSIVATASSCNDTPNGTITAYGGFSPSGYTYELYNSSGIKIDKISTLINYINNNLTEGNYYLYITNKQSGSCTSALNVYVPGPISYYIQQTSFGCGSGCNNSAKVIITRGNVWSHKWSNGETGPNPVNLCGGMNYDTLTIDSVGICKFVDSVFIINLPFANASFNYGKTNYCTSESFAVISNFPITTGGTFSIADDLTSGATVNSSTGTVTLTGLTTGGRIVVKYVTDPPCNAVFMDTIVVEISPPSVTNYTNHNICFGSSNPSFINTFNNTINWYSDSALTNLINTQAPSQPYDPFNGSITDIGTYVYYVTQVGLSASACQSIPTRITITVHPMPIVDAGQNETICPGFGVNLIATGAGNYIWQPGNLVNDATLPNPIASPQSTTTFTVTGTDPLSGCSSSDTVTIIVSENGKCTIVIYNGFTPNGDNHNDFWYIDGISSDEKNAVTIFNRWGEKLWETTHYDNQNNKWEGLGPSGKILPDGTYFYVIHYKNETFKGWVELTR